MTKPDLTDDELSALFSSANTEVEPIDPAFLARLQDVAEEAASKPSPAPARPLSHLSRLIEAIGGWGGAGGLVAASAAGFWLGVSSPEVLIDATTTFGLGSGALESGIWPSLTEFDLSLEDG